jgi:NAD(P) transhydrogenase subunit alpha
MGGGQNYTVNLDDEVIQGALVTQEGTVTWSPVKPAVKPPAAADHQNGKVQNGKGNPGETAAVKISVEGDRPHPPSPQSPVSPRPAPKLNRSLWLPLIGLALLGVGVWAPASFLSHFTVFVLACFIGWQVIWNVKPALHTPLMSVTNAISGIIIIGGMLQISGALGTPTTLLGAIAIFIGTINISGGFLVTQRMLKMFQREGG